MNSSLDLFSTSPTGFKQPKGKSNGKDKKVYDACANNAPYFAYHIEGRKWGVVQGCCNDWNCPRCGLQRAKEEYGRIVVGSRQLAETHQLYMLTITCLGKEMSLEESEANYLAWTNRLHDRLRLESKRASKVWAYAAVTERQKRGHPHSHYITTYCPDDAEPIKKGERKTYFTSGEVFPAKHDTLQSSKLERACVECGLGRQYEISRLRSAEAGSRYAAKYLFKGAIFETIWPKGWRRVRYSQNWFKWPKKESNAFVLMTAKDWIALFNTAKTIATPDDGVRMAVLKNLTRADITVY